MHEMLRAAHIQGIYTFTAGLLAFAGGSLAYWAARQETKRKEKKDKELEASYCIHMRAITGHALNTMKDLNRNSISYSQIFPIIEAFKLGSWQDNSLLGLEAQKNISILHANVSKWEKLYIFHGSDGKLTSEAIKNILETLENIKNEIDYKLDTDFDIRVSCDTEECNDSESF